MIALDTNVLLRYLVGDDSAQHRAAARLIEEEVSEQRPGFVSLVVLAELAWVLSRSLGYARTAVHGVLTGLLAARQLQMQLPEVVARAALLFEQGMDFPDALILSIGQSHGCTELVTFDRRFAAHAGTRLLTIPATP